MSNRLKRNVLWLRVSYWTGITVDFIVGVRMLMPSIMGETELRYAMATSASLMFGWTILLIWADRKPVERKGVLLLTVFPVIIGLLASTLIPVLGGVFPVARMVPAWILGPAIICLMGYSYYNARDAE